MNINFAKTLNIQQEKRGSITPNALTNKLLIQLQYQSLLICLLYYILQDMQSEQVELSENQLQTQGRWNPDQHNKFLQALMVHGKNWKIIQTVVQTRTTAQVRSHAQKFFLKMHKIEKERKKNLKKGITQPSKADLQLTKTLLEQTISTNTPSQILHFLRREPPVAPVIVQDQQSSVTPNLNQVLKHGVSHILDEVLDANQESSFLLALIRHNNGFRDPQQALAGMIAFPQIHREEKEEEQTANKRKKSFSLYEEEQDEERYYGVVKKMRGL